MPDPVLNLISRCDGATVWDLVDRSDPLRVGRNLGEVTEGLKAARTLGVVEWDFAIRPEDGVLLRRRPLGQEPESWSWFFLPPLTKYVFDQCSGAWSCEQIGARIGDLPTYRGSDAMPGVLAACAELVRIGVIEWIDDIHQRKRRLEEFSGHPNLT